MLYGYAGRIAYIDLSSNVVEVVETPTYMVKNFIGGKGFLYYLGYKNIPVIGDALNPSMNALIIAPGALAGIAPSASKVGFLAKSPLTGLLCDSYAGQTFASKLKLAGFDAVVVKGKASKPVYIYIHDERIEIRGAQHLWGSNTWDVVHALREETKRGASVAVIGPAGEKQVRYANIIVDGFRAAGRCGLGAVMGAMNLKAIVVWGYRRPPLADPARLRKLFIEVYTRISKDPMAEYNRKYATLRGVETCSKRSMCPTRHWSRPWIPREEASKLSAENILKREVELSIYRKYAGILWGWSCPVKCSKLVRVERKGLEHIVVKPEYEILAMLGLIFEIYDVDDILYLEWLLNNLGIDVISFGEVASWFLELYEKGLIRRKDINGVKAEPRFGNSSVVKELAELIAERRGIGAILAEGVLRASQILGKGAELAVHVKGLESAGWDPRGRQGLALSYATADIGASHLRGWPSTSAAPSTGINESIVRSMLEDRDWKAVMDSLGLCIFSPYTAEEALSFYEAATGIKLSKKEAMLVGWRVEAIARIFAALAGKVPDEDSIPDKWMEPIPEGPLKGEKAFKDWSDFKNALKLYYRLRGYHEEYGIPMPDTLQQLGLEWLVVDAERAFRLIEERLRPGLKI